MYTILGTILGDYAHPPWCPGWAECDDCKEIRRMSLLEDIHDRWWDTDDSEWPSDEDEIPRWIQKELK